MSSLNTSNLLLELSKVEKLCQESLLKSSFALDSVRELIAMVGPVPTSEDPDWGRDERTLEGGDSDDNVPF